MQAWLDEWRAYLARSPTPPAEVYEAAAPAPAAPLIGADEARDLLDVGLPVGLPKEGRALRSAQAAVHLAPGAATAMAKWNEPPITAADGVPVPEDVVAPVPRVSYARLIAGGEAERELHDVWRVDNLEDPHLPTLREGVLVLEEATAVLPAGSADPANPDGTPGTLEPLLPVGVDVALASRSADALIRYARPPVVGAAGRPLQSVAANGALRGVETLATWSVPVPRLVVPVLEGDAAPAGVNVPPRRLYVRGPRGSPDAHAFAEEAAQLRAMHAQRTAIDSLSAVVLPDTVGPLRRPMVELLTHTLLAASDGPRTDLPEVTDPAVRAWRQNLLMVTLWGLLDVHEAHVAGGDPQIYGAIRMDLRLGRWMPGIGGPLTRTELQMALASNQEALGDLVFRFPYAELPADVEAIGGAAAARVLALAGGNRAALAAAVGQMPTRPSLEPALSVWWAYLSARVLGVGGAGAVAELDQRLRALEDPWLAAYDALLQALAPRGGGADEPAGVPDALEVRAQALASLGRKADLQLASVALEQRMRLFGDAARRRGAPLVIERGLNDAAGDPVILRGHVATEGRSAMVQLVRLAGEPPEKDAVVDSIDLRDGGDFAFRLRPAASGGRAWAMWQGGVYEIRAAIEAAGEEEAVHVLTAPERAVLRIAAKCARCGATYTSDEALNTKACRWAAPLASLLVSEGVDARPDGQLVETDVGHGVPPALAALGVFTLEDAAADLAALQGGDAQRYRARFTLAGALDLVARLGREEYARVPADKAANVVKLEALMRGGGEATSETIATASYAADALANVVGAGRRATALSLARSTIEQVFGRVQTLLAAYTDALKSAGAIEPPGSKYAPPRGVTDYHGWVALVRVKDMTMTQCAALGARLGLWTDAARARVELTRNEVLVRGLRDGGLEAFVRNVVEGARSRPRSEGRAAPGAVIYEDRHNPYNGAPSLMRVAHGRLLRGSSVAVPEDTGRLLARIAETAEAIFADAIARDGGAGEAEDGGDVARYGGVLQAVAAYNYWLIKAPLSAPASAAAQGADGVQRILAAYSSVIERDGGSVNAWTAAALQAARAERDAEPGASLAMEVSGARASAAGTAVATDLSARRAADAAPLRALRAMDAAAVRALADAATVREQVAALALC